MDIKPFKKLPILKYFQHDLEKIKMAFRLSDSIRKDLANIRAAGDQVELAVKDFYASKLHPRYHVCDGHLVDQNLKVSPQFDIIVSENSKNPTLFNLADKSEIVYYDTVLAYGEVKRTFYDSKILSNFSKNIARMNSELCREAIAPTFIETSNSGIHVENPLTNLPLRNPLLKFVFIVNGSTMSMDMVSAYLSKTENKNIPNYIVILDIGIIVNVSREKYNQGKLEINLYPEFSSDNDLWILLELPDENSTLIYQYLLLIEHLNSSIVSSPKIINYTKELFQFSISDAHKL